MRKCDSGHGSVVLVKLYSSQHVRLPKGWVPRWQEDATIMFALSVTARKVPVV